jgi:EAL and modified HD-GYP domain-containing signal transduction protein
MFTRRSSPAAILPASPEERELDERVLVSRQPVMDGYLRVIGYRIAYALPAEEAPSAMSLFDTVLSVIGLERLIGADVAHLPISREMLLTLGTPPVRPDRLQLRIRYADAIDPALTATLQEAAHRGYTLELDALPGPHFDLDLLALFGVVELDLARWEADDLMQVIPEIRARNSAPLAVGVRDHAEREFAETLGFRMFEGPFYGTPKIVKGRNIPTGDVRALATIVQLQGDDVSLEEVVEVIDRDLGLSVRLLRYINSAYFGMAAQVSSIHDAAMRLGSRGVARWALTTTFTGAPQISPEVALMALTRARLCEILGADAVGVDPRELFTIGLLSAADGVFGRPLITIIPELPLTATTTSALLDHAGPAGAILRAVLAYERGDLGNSVLERLGRGHGRSYRNALGWAKDTLIHSS